MATTRSAGWIGGAAVLIFAVLAATYFFLYTPKVEATDQTMLEVTAAQSQNDMLEVEVADLAAKFLKIDDYKAELDELGVQIPSTANLADIVGAIHSMATTAGVTVTEEVPGGPMTVTVPTPVATTAATPTATDGTTDTSGSAVDQAGQTADDAEAAADAHDDPATDDTGDGTVAPTPTGPVQIDGFIAMPYSITVVGGYPNALSFLAMIQTNPGRLFLASDVEFTRQVAAEPGQGKPATADGDVQLKITGYYYVLLDPAGAATLDEGGDGTAPAMPGSDANPFVPLTPSKVAEG